MVATVYVSRHDARAGGLRRGVLRLNDVIEQQACEGCQLTLRQDEMLPQPQHRGEVTAGFLIEKSDAVDVLVAKVGYPLSQRSGGAEVAGRNLEHRQQMIHVDAHVSVVRPRMVPERVCSRHGDQAPGSGIDYRRLMRRQEPIRRFGRYARQYPWKQDSPVAGHVPSMTRKLVLPRECPRHGVS